MSIALLLDKYDVSTEDGLQKALNEIEKEEAEVEEALCGALSKACAIEGRLRTASQAYAKLGEVKNDALSTSDMVERTAILARDVSAKVRQLDLARSRVAECQQRVNDLIDLQLCSAGVEAAIKAQDYETGAAHVSRFLSMDPGSVAAARARGAPDPRDTMLRAADTLRDRLVHKFEEAARKDDEAAIDRLYKLFPQIGRADEGVELLSKYLAKKLEASQRRICTAEGSGCAYADALTRWLEAGGAAVERARGAAPGHLPDILRHVQPRVCAGARRVCHALMTSHSGVAEGADPLLLEPVVTELALAHSRIMLYFGFLRRKAEVDASTLKEAERESLLAAVETIISGCDLTRTTQDLLGHYLTLERYFLEESVSKALRLSRTADSSSLVDDTFFVARKVIRRAITSGSLEGVCVVLNDTSSALEHNVSRALRTALRSAPAGTLPLPPPAPTAPPASLLASTMQGDLRDARALFLALMNEAEAGADWAERLGEEAYNEALPLTRTAAEQEKLSSCASQLAGAGAALRTAHARAQAALLASLRQAARAHAAFLAQPKSLEDGDDSELIPAALDTLHAAARAALSAASADELLASLLAEIAARAEDDMLRHLYTREQGMIVERRARRLATWSGAVGARERCAALTQAAELLATEHVPARAPPRVPPARTRDLLARRVDFKIEDIKKLKL